MTFKVGIYARVSSEEQAENPEGSIKNQEQRLRDYVRFRNADGSPWGEVAGVFVDAGISAKDMKRPAFQRLLQKIRAKEINLVLVSDLSRFTRSTKDFSVLWDFMSANGCKFQSLRENFDSTTAAGEMIMFTLANFAQFERKQTGERIASSFSARAKRGLYNGGKVSLGYTVDETRPGYLKVVKEDADVVRRIFRTYLQEGTLAATARRLNREGVKFASSEYTNRTGFFTNGNLHGLLKNRNYLGMKRYKERGVWKETKASWEPIIDELTFERVQKIMKKNHSRLKPPSHERYPYLFTGLIYCASCGERLGGKSAYGQRGEKFGYYDHTKAKRIEAVKKEKVCRCWPVRVPAVKVEPVVWRAVREFLTDKNTAKELLWLAKAKAKKAPETKKEEGRLKALISQVSLLAERIASLPREVDPKPLFERLAALQADEAALKKALEAKQASQVDEPLDTADFEKFQGQMIELLRREDDPAVKAKIIERVVEKVLIKEKGIEIHFHAGALHFKRELGQTPGSRLFPCPEPQTGTALPFRRARSYITSGKSAVEGSSTLTQPQPIMRQGACAGAGKNIGKLDVAVFARAARSFAEDSDLLRDRSDQAAG